MKNISYSIRLKDQIQVHKADSDEVIRLKMSLEKYSTHLKELSVLKNKNQQLYKSVQVRLLHKKKKSLKKNALCVKDYLNQIVQLNEQVASIPELKHSNDLYKKKLSDMVTLNLVTLSM
jgi:type II secretory pathway component PulF